jgi:hypothetical protein
MPGGSTIARGNMIMVQAIQATLMPAASVTAGASVTSTYTIANLAVGDMVDLYPQAIITAPLSFGAIWVSASNTLSVQWVNASASTSSASPTAVLFEMLVNRPENASLAGIANLPNGVY